VLDAFAELVSATGGDLVADLGCGPGRVTGYLRSRGLTAFGVDLSPAMVDEARRRHPGLRFEVGSMSALDLDDGVLAGIVAWYSIIHTPPHDLQAVFAECCRVLASGGYALFAFQVGDARVHLEHAYGHAVALDAYRLSPDAVSVGLQLVGLPESARLVREPDAREKTPQAFVLARKRTAR
jgi:SAM-dependent methyltransferase